MGRLGLLPVIARPGLVFAVALVTLASVCIGDSGAATPVAPRLFISASGSDNGSCSRSSPCRSLRSAYLNAHPGDVVEIGGGQYGSQMIPRDASKENATKNVIFRPAQGAHASFGSLKVYGSHLELRDLAIDGYDT